MCPPKAAFFRRNTAGNGILLQESAFSVGKSIFLQENASFYRKTHFSALHSEGLRIVNGGEFQKASALKWGCWLAQVLAGWGGRPLLQRPYVSP